MINQDLMQHIYSQYPWDTLWIQHYPDQAKAYSENDLDELAHYFILAHITSQKKSGPNLWFIFY